ncbi:MAG: UDP-N-acetylmuramoyl-L-alanine--D-glutamate ligase [Gammaproteobacteria bacterium]
MSTSLFIRPSAAHDDTRASGARGTCVVLGLGATGLSCARHLSAAGFAVLVLDSRQHPPAAEQLRMEVPNAKMLSGTLDTELPADTQEIVLSPGLGTDLPLAARARKLGLPVVGDIELFARAVQAPVAAITGSNGKSTVTTMLALMAEAAGRRVLAGANLGTPALDLLREPTPDLFALELSSFQLEVTASLTPAVAAVLNISADHIDRHGSLDAYAAAKSRIYRGARTAVANRQDPLVMAMVKAHPDVLTFGMDSPGPGHFGLLGQDAGMQLARGKDALMPAADLGVSGLHNAANALAALAIGSALGLEMDPMLQALRDFPGLPHRTQTVANALQMRWIDDSKATNVGAAMAAIEGLPGPILLIAGGDGKGQDFEPLAAALADRARAAILLGRDAPILARALGDVCPVHLVTDMSEAVDLAASLGQAGDTVLLSPACSSLDMYTSYAQRGAAFANAARELTA